mgnify:CR=1 FL=1
MTNNKTILAWIDEMKALVNPDQVVWIDGSEEQLEALAQTALQQINDRSYSAEMQALGIKSIIKYGLAFSGKSARIAAEKQTIA